MINQKMVCHTENFWGSGSYSKTVRPNGFLFTDVEIYRQQGFVKEIFSLISYMALLLGRFFYMTFDALSETSWLFDEVVLEPVDWRFSSIRFE
jgi:hypothetical protein